MPNHDEDSRVLDAGCGPGLVSEAFLRAGHRVVGVDLSAAMIDRARMRCAPWGERGVFRQQSVLDPLPESPFDAAVSRFVLHHVADPAAFVRRQVELLGPGGVLVVCDHTSDPDGEAARWHNDLERARDRSHTRNVSPGALVDLLAAAGLEGLRLAETPLVLDFDEWFDHGTPAEPKEAVRRRLLAGAARGFRPQAQPDGRVWIRGWIAAARGVRPGA